MLVKKDTIMLIFSYFGNYLKTILENPWISNVQGQIQNDPRLNLFEACGCLIAQSKKRDEIERVVIIFLSFEFLLFLHFK